MSFILDTFTTIEGFRFTSQRIHSRCLLQNRIFLFLFVFVFLSLLSGSSFRSQTQPVRTATSARYARVWSVWAGLGEPGRAGAPHAISYGGATLSLPTVYALLQTDKPYVPPHATTAHPAAPRLVLQPV